MKQLRHVKPTTPHPASTSARPAAEQGAQRRRAPAYQEYASDNISQESIRLASLRALGLAWQMRMHCWVNGDVPRDPKPLAGLLGQDEQEIRDILPDVLGLEVRTQSDNLPRPMFEPTARTPSRLHCPELTEQRKQQFERHAERSTTGRRGAIKRWEKEKKGDGSANGSANGSLSRAEASRQESRVVPPHAPPAYEDDIPF